MEYFDWQQQLYSQSTRGWAFAILAATALFCLASFWWTRIAGGVHPRERSRVRDSVGTTFAFAGAIVCPLLLFLGVAYMLFPLKPPHTLALASRVRPDTEAWHQEWKLRFDALKPSTETIYDVGPAVDRICHDLTERRDDLHFDQSSPAAVAAIREIVSKHLIENAPKLERVSTSDAALKTDGSASQLPRWVVQSVEITTLRVLTRQYNVARIAALFSDSTGGAFPTSSVRQLLGREPLRIKNIDTENVVVLPRSGEIELVGLLAVRTEATKTSIDSLIFSSRRQSKQLTLEVVGKGQRRSSALIDADLHPGFSVQQFQFALPLPADVLEESNANLTHDPTVALPLPRDPKSLSQIRLLFSGPKASAFKDTFDRLVTDNEPAIHEWRERMSTFGFDVNSRRFVVGEGAGDIEISCLNTSVTIRQAHDERTSSSVLPAPPSVGDESVSEPGRPYRGQNIRSAVPGVNSFNGLPLRPGSKISVSGSAKFTDTLVNAEFLGDSLVSCSIPLRSPTHKLLRAPVISATFAGPNPQFFIGLDFEEQSMLLGQTESSPNERLLSAWSSIVEGAYRLRLQSAVDTAPERNTVELPMLLVDDAAMQALQSRQVAVNVLGYSIALAALTLFFSRALSPRT